MTNALTHLDISPLLVVATVVLGGAVAVNLRFTTGVSVSHILVATGLFCVSVGLWLVASVRKLKTAIARQSESRG
jgi:protein-S-isoprenylcysteine O-methyltransferase Ste14